MFGYSEGHKTGQESIERKDSLFQGDVGVQQRGDGGMRTSQAAGLGLSCRLSCHPPLWWRRLGDNFQHCPAPKTVSTCIKALTLRHWQRASSNSFLMTKERSLLLQLFAGYLIIIWLTRSNYTLNWTWLWKQILLNKFLNAVYCCMANRH